ncbi:hypothetical protein D3C71_1713440 [compost metagenome]
MLMILLFPLAFLVVLAIWLAHVWKKRSVKSAPSAITTTLVALVVCYALGLALISIDPWYDDNGAPEFISWQYRWVWAGWLASWLAILVLPLVVGLRALVLCRAKYSEKIR